MGKAISKAVELLKEIVERAAAAMAYEVVSAILGAPSGVGGTGGSFPMTPADPRRHAMTLEGHVESIAAHAQGFAAKTGSVSFA